MLRSTRIPETTTETHHSPRRRRDDRGLTTLEWLLIVAAVAGLAALAVVLVQNVVDDTAEQIAGSSARLTAAQVAADSITNDYKTVANSAEGRAAEASPDPGDAGKAKRDDAEAKAEAACNRLNITYSDVLSQDAGAPKKAEWRDEPRAANSAADAEDLAENDPLNTAGVDDTCQIGPPWK